MPEHRRTAKRPMFQDAPVDFQPLLCLNPAFHAWKADLQTQQQSAVLSKPESPGQQSGVRVNPDLRFARHLSAPELPQLGNILGVLGDRAQSQPKLMLQRQSALLGDGIASGTAESSQDIIARLQGQIAAMTEAAEAQGRVVEALKVRTDQTAVSNTTLVVEYANNAAGSASGQQVQAHRAEDMVASTMPVATASEEDLPRRIKHTHLDSSAVVRIFLAKRSGYTGFVSRTLSKRLSAEYGLTPKAVRDIWSMKTWKKVTQPYWNAEDR